MSEGFDPYYVWLAIPPSEQPPNCYRLLGLNLFESNAKVIANAADRQMAHVKAQATGQYALVTQRLLTELSQAKVCLLNVQKKAAYDDVLMRTLSAPSQPVIPLAEADMEIAESESIVDLLSDLAATPPMSSRDGQSSGGLSSKRNLTTLKRRRTWPPRSLQWLSPVLMAQPLVLAVTLLIGYWFSRGCAPRNEPELAPIPDAAAPVSPAMATPKTPAKTAAPATSDVPSDAKSD